jgi:hypothetical protein
MSLLRLDFTLGWIPVFKQPCSFPRDLSGRELPAIGIVTGSLSLCDWAFHRQLHAIASGAGSG